MGVLVPKRAPPPPHVLRLRGRAPILPGRPRRRRRFRGRRGISAVFRGGPSQVLCEGVRGSVRRIGRGVVRRMQERDDCVSDACQVAAAEINLVRRGKDEPSCSEQNYHTGLILGTKIILVRGCDNVAGKLRQEWKAAPGKSNQITK